MEGLLHSSVFDSPHMIYTGDFIEDPLIHYTDSHELEAILTVSPGMALKDIRTYLKRYDLKLYGTPESKYITIGGAILCGAHNGSHYWDSMANHVIGMLIVDGQGNLSLLTDPDLFVNYGLLGVVLRLSIKVYKATSVKYKHALLKSLDGLSVAPSTLCLLFGPYSGRILKTDIFMTKEKAHRSLKRLFWDLSLMPLSSRIVSKLEVLLTTWIPAIGIFASELFTYEPDAIRGKFDYFEHVPRSHAFSLEYALDQKNLVHAYERIMEIISAFRKKGTYVLRFWCRFQKATEIINDLAYGRDTTLVEVTLNDQQKNARLMVRDLSKILVELGDKPHLGKTVLEPEVVENYDFTKLKKAIRHHDPYGLFQNEFTKSALRI